MTFMGDGTGMVGCRCVGMNKLDTSRTMHQIAARMRLHALETSLPEYQDVMRRTANTLDTEAELIAEQHLLEFSCALQAFSDSQFSTW
jgi:hypothetical protein